MCKIKLNIRLADTSVVEPFHFGPAPASQDGGSGSSSSSVVSIFLLLKKLLQISLPSSMMFVVFQKGTVGTSVFC